MALSKQHTVNFKGVIPSTIICVKTVYGDSLGGFRIIYCMFVRCIIKY